MKQHPLLRQRKQEKDQDFAPTPKKKKNPHRVHGPIQRMAR